MPQQTTGNDALAGRIGGAVTVQRVFKSFRTRAGETAALEAVNLTVAPGEFVCLFGPSGCGKSTLLNVVAGFIGADSGTILADGIPVTGPRADLCMLFQSASLFPWLTVLDNVLFGPKARGLLAPSTRDQAMQLLHDVGLQGFERHFPHQLSGGMRHRAAFARALINNPAVLLMDEPFGALDAITRAQMQEFLLELWQRARMTVLFVTHDVEEATLLADRVCIMSPRPGRIIKDVRVSLRRPRSYADTETQAFIVLRRSIRQVVEAAIPSVAAGPGL